MIRPSMETTDQEPAELHSEESFPILTDQNRIRRSRVPWGRLAAVLYSLFLLWQFIGTIVYTIRAVECSTKEKLESFHCGNSTAYPHSKDLELAWYISRLLLMLLSATAIQKVPGFIGYVSTLSTLKLMTAFWTLFLLLSLGLVRYVVILVCSRSFMNFSLIVCFISIISELNSEFPAI